MIPSMRQTSRELSFAVPPVFSNTTQAMNCLSPVWQWGKRFSPFGVRKTSIPMLSETCRRVYLSIRTPGTHFTDAMPAPEDVLQTVVRRHRRDRLAGIGPAEKHQAGRTSN